MCASFDRAEKESKERDLLFPDVSYILVQLEKQEVFSKIGANSGFWQVELNSICKLGPVHHIHYIVGPPHVFIRIPSGISSAPEQFQRRMEEILPVVHS